MSPEETTTPYPTEEAGNIVEEVEEMEIGDLDLDAIEKAVADKCKGYVFAKQVKLLEEAILQVNPSKTMGIDS